MATTITEDQYKELVLLNIGDDGTIATSIDLLWDKNSSWSPLYWQYLHTWRDAIIVAMGQIWRDVTVRMPTRAQISLREKFSNLQTMAKYVEFLITDFQASGGVAGVAGVVSVDEMITTLTIPGTPGFPDPNDPKYRGDPTRVQQFQGWPW